LGQIAIQDERLNVAVGGDDAVEGGAAAGILLEEEVGCVGLV
jgi:hypothetical protein